MFEKEAESYATRECCMTCNNINHFCKEKCECWTSAKKGAEFGYSKCNTQLTKAKELIKDLIDSLEVIDGEQIRELKVVKEAEQFISVEVEQSISEEYTIQKDILNLWEQTICEIRNDIKLQCSPALVYAKELCDKLEHSMCALAGGHYKLRYSLD